MTAADEDRFDRAYTKAWEAADRGEWEDALGHLTEITDSHPRWAGGWAIHGSFLHELERDEEAESAFRRAIRLDPTNEGAWTEYGLLKLDQGYVRKAAFCFRRSLELRPDHNTYTLLAAAELEFDAQAALLSAESALALEPTWDEAANIRDVAKRKIAEHGDDDAEPESD